MLADAAEELEQVGPEDCDRLDVLEARMEFLTRLRGWEDVAEVGRKMARRYPEVEAGWIGWAYALREAQRIEESRAVLVEAEPLHGEKSAVLNFNMACYCALLGEPQVAREYLARACKLRPEFRKEALDDPDLASLWV